jgi:hypothetical protein
MNLFFIRALRAAKLDASLFDEVMADAKARTQAIIVVFLYGAAVAYGIFGRGGRCHDQQRHIYDPDRVVYLGFFRLYHRCAHIP